MSGNDAAAQAFHEAFLIVVNEPKLETNEANLYAKILELQGLLMDQSSGAAQF